MNRPTPGPAPRNAAAPFLDVTRLPLLGSFLRWRHARTALQLPLFGLAMLMVYDGFTGPALAPKNLATVLTWLHYRGLLVIALLVAGNLFCMACPFMLSRNLARRLLRPTRSWPVRLRNKWLAGAVLAGYLFLYESLNLFESPPATALVILLYFGAALVLDSLFRGAPFCKYVCPLGQFNFLASTLSPLEVKVREPHRCADCATKDCIAGRGEVPGCELWLFQEKKVGNLDCTFCLDCVQACPHGNVGVLVRTPAVELTRDPYRSSLGRLSRRTDLAALMVAFTFGALLNIFGMISPVYALWEWLGRPPENGFLAGLFVAMLVLEPMLLLGLASALSRRARGGSLVSEATAFAPCLIPLGFGVWLAHYLFHFLTGFLTLVPVLQQFLRDLGWKLPPPNWAVAPLVAPAELGPLEVGLVGLGFWGSALVAASIARRRSEGVSAVPVAAPWWVLLALLAGAAVWMLQQPMEMRGTFMS